MSALSSASSPALRAATTIAVLGAALGFACDAHADPPAAAAAAPQQPPPTYVIVSPGVAPPLGALPPGAYYAPPGTPPPGAYYAPPGAMPQQPPESPEYLEYEDGDPIPAGYHRDSHARTGLVIGGAVTLGVSYLISAFTAGIGQLISDANAGLNSTKSKDDFGPLLIPIAGPFVGLATTHPSSGGATSLVLLGALQVGGAAMLIGGIASPQIRLKRNDLGLPLLTLRPTIGFGSLGLQGEL